MLIKFRRILFLDILDVRTYFFAFFWLTGLICGAALAVYGSWSHSNMALSFAAAHPSVLVMAISRGAPIILIWFLSYYGDLRWIYGIGFAEMLLFGYSVSTISLFFGTSAWLVSGLLMFSAGGMLIPVFLLAMRCLSGRKIVFTELLCYIGVAFAFILLDYFAVSPFLVSLIVSL